MNTWESQYLESKRQEEIARKQRQVERFVENYPDISFQNLKDLSAECEIHTDDGCSHYIDLEHKKVYSYNFNSEKWITHSASYQESIIHLYKQNTGSMQD